MKLQVLTFIAECDRVRKLLRSCKTRSRILQREDFHIESPAFSFCGIVTTSKLWYNSPIRNMDGDHQ